MANELVVAPKSSRQTLRSAATFAPIVAVFIGPLRGVSHFWVNDDVGHLLWVSGGFTGTPDPLNPVVGPIFGVVVSSLYRVTVSVPWYTLGVLAVPVICSHLLLRYVSHRTTLATFSSLVALLSWATLLLGVQPNYTFASFVTCAAALLLLLAMLTHGQSGFWSYGCILLLCVLGLSLRVNWSTNGIFLPPGFAFALVIAIAVIVTQLHQISTRKALTFMALTFAVYLIAWVPQLIVIQVNKPWSTFIDFYNARGALDGNNKVAAYLSATSVDDVLAQTGMDQAAILELSSWSLFDAESVSSSQLRRLSEAVNRFHGMRPASVRYSLAAASIGTFIREAWLLVAATSLLLFQKPEQLRGKAALRHISTTVTILLATCGLIVVSTSGVRFPDYVLVGTIVAASLGIIVGSSLSSSQETSVSSRSTVMRIASIALLTIGLVNLGRGTWSVLLHGRSSSHAEVSRQTLRESNRLEKPVIHDPHLVGKAYQSSPFDTSIPNEYLASMSFGGGSNVRSPQYVKRWNHLTGESQTDDSLFDTNFYRRVIFKDNEFPFSFQRFSHLRELCTTLKDLGEGTAVLDYHRYPCGKLHINFTGLAGIQLKVNSDIDESAMWLHSPSTFRQRARIRVHDQDGVEKIQFDVTVQPRNGKGVIIRRLNPGDVVTVEPLDQCPKSVDVQSNDAVRTSAGCITLSEIFVDGVAVPRHP